MRISDWSSDVCSSDLGPRPRKRRCAGAARESGGGRALPGRAAGPVMMLQYFANGIILGATLALGAIGLTLTYNILRFANFAHGEFLTFGAYFDLVFVSLFASGADRKRVVKGKSVSVRVDLGGSRFIEKKTSTTTL